MLEVIPPEGLIEAYNGSLLSSGSAARLLQATMSVPIESARDTNRRLPRSCLNKATRLKFSYSCINEVFCVRGNFPLALFFVQYT